MLCVWHIQSKNKMCEEDGEEQDTRWSSFISTQRSHRSHDTNTIPLPTLSWWIFLTFTCCVHNISSPRLLRGKFYWGAGRRNCGDTCVAQPANFETHPGVQCDELTSHFITVHGDLTVKVLPALSSGRTVSPLEVLNQELNSVSSISRPQGFSCYSGAAALIQIWRNKGKLYKDRWDLQSPRVWVNMLHVCITEVFCGVCP